MGECSQKGILLVTVDELAAALKLPPGHVIERITAMEHPYEVGILIAVSGPMMPFHPINSPLAIEPIGWVLQHQEERMASASAVLAKQR